MYHSHYSIWSILRVVIETFILFVLYSTYLLNISLTISLIIPTMGLSFIFLIKDCSKISSQIKNRFLNIFLLRQYYRVFKLLLKSNDIMIYGTIGIVLIYNIPIHSTLVTYITTFSVPETREFLFLLILLIQTCGFIILLFVPATVNKRVLDISKRLEKTFFGMDKQDVKLKWKYLIQLEFLQSKPQVGYTLLPYGAITFKLAIEV